MPKKVSECTGCDGCPMQGLFPDNNFVPVKHGEGLRLVIAEAPGQEESLVGEPLVGGSGRWFDNIARKAGLNRKMLTLTNVLSCRPPNNVFPTSPDARSYISLEDGLKAVDHCYKSYLKPLLVGRPWRRIDLLGEKALRFVARKAGGILAWRGSPLPIEEIHETKLVAIPTLHPAYIMRDQSMIPVMIHDLKKSLVKPPEDYILYPSIEQVRAFKAKKFAFDIEMDPRDGYKTLTMVGLSAEPYKAICVPFRGSYKEELKRIFAEAQECIGHNSVQFDIPKLEERGVPVNPECVLWDTMLMQHLLQPDLSHKLEFVGTLFTNKGAWKAQKGENEELYNCRDTDVTMQIFGILKAMLKQQNLENLYHNVQVPLAKICKLMETTGFKIDPSQIKTVRARISKEMHDLEKDLPEHIRTHDVIKNKRAPAPKGTLSEKTGKPLKYISVPIAEPKVPWRSKLQVEKFLYEELGLPVQMNVKTQRVTTDKTAMEKLYRKTKNPSLRAIMRLRKLDELLTTFMKEDMTKVDAIHSRFNPHGTNSGRLSSAGPNLQNVPESARYVYVSHTPGWKIIDVDYSQIENRLTAYFAGDDERLSRFIKDPDFSEHKRAVEVFFGIPYADVIKDNDRSAPYGKAKSIVHGTNYGMGARKICNMYDMDFKEVKELIRKWKEANWKTVQWQDLCSKEAKSRGYLTTPFGRKRWFYTTSYHTEALSFLPQSTAADIIFRAMIALMYKRIGWPAEKVENIVGYMEALPEPARLLLQIHDSLIIESPPEKVDEVVGVLRRVMEQPFRELGGLTIPIGVQVGDSWGSVEKYEG